MEINNNITKTERILSDLIFKFNELQMIIINSRQIVGSLEGETKKSFLIQLMPLMDEFELLIDKLKIFLEIYFKEEKENHLPRNLNLYKFYKDLNDEF